MSQNLTSQHTCIYIYTSIHLDTYTYIYIHMYSTSAATSLEESMLAMCCRYWRKCSNVLRYSTLKRRWVPNSRGWADHALRRGGFSSWHIHTQISAKLSLTCWLACNLLRISTWLVLHRSARLCDLHHLQINVALALWPSMLDVAHRRKREKLESWELFCKLRPVPLSH